MRIGDVAAKSGVSTRALRYYEEQGLLGSARTPSGQRDYSASAVERVRLIQQFFAAGLPSRTILRLLPCVETGQASDDVFALLEGERERITATMAELEAARDALDRMIDIARHPTPEHCPALRVGDEAVDLASSSGASAAAPVAASGAASSSPGRAALAATA